VVEDADALAAEDVVVVAVEVVSATVRATMGTVIVEEEEEVTAGKALSARPFLSFVRASPLANDSHLDRVTCKRC